MYSSQQSWLGRLINSSINAFRQEAACTVSAYFLTESGSAGVESAFVVHLSLVAASHRSVRVLIR